MSILATNDISHDMETGRGDGAATDESDESPSQQKQRISSIIAALLLLLAIGLVSYYDTSWSSNNNSNLPTVASSEQNRHLIDLSSWFEALSPPTQSPTRKPTVDVSDWAEALKVTPSPTRFPTRSLINESFSKGYGLFSSNHSSI